MGYGREVGALSQQLDDPAFPQITYRREAGGAPTPVLRGSGLRVQTVVIAREQRGLSAAEIAEEYGLTPRQIEEALAFNAGHRDEIDAHLQREVLLAGEAHG